jgi:WD40 repeat protein
MYEHYRKSKQLISAMPAITYHTREQFLNGYDFPLSPAQDFKQNGHPAEYASGHPWPASWHSNAEAIDFSNELKEKNKGASTTLHSSLSSDQRLLAISSSLERILIYDVASKELRATLEGTGHIVFRPAQDPEINGYTLISSISDHEARAALSCNKLILWDLDKHGRLLDEEEPIDSAAFATKAIDSILPELISTHEWTKDFAQASNLHADFEKALSKVAADHRRRHHTILDNARLGNFGSVAFSDDGRLLLYHGENGSTQRGMREAEKLPHVVVYNMDTGKKVHDLRGHTDAIMWSAISPDYRHVASVSWDGTMRMYSATTGDLEWATNNSGGQSWAGAFAPDSKHIVWSCNKGREIQVLDVADGQKVSTFQPTLNQWCREFAWDPTGEHIVLCERKHAYIWRPFDGPDGTLAQHFLLEEHETWILASIKSIDWTDYGRAVVLQFSEGTKLVYDLQTNSKEIFLRPKEVESPWESYGFYSVPETREQPSHYLSVDGDAKVRYIRPSVPSTSWWEKEPEGEAITPTAKRMYPETGKYVKITKVPSKEPRQKDADRASWVGKGAELWTAE